MHVNAIGLSTSMVSGGGSKQKTSASFSNILGGLTNQFETSIDNQQKQIPIKKEITNLIHLFESDSELAWNFDLGNLEKIKNTSLGDPEAISIAIELLQLNGEELINVIGELLSGGLNRNENIENPQLSKFLEELPTMNSSEVLQGLIPILPLINVDEVKMDFEKDSTSLIKTLKLIDYLTQEKETKTVIQDFLQKVSQQLQTLMNQNKAASRMDILNRIITPLATELNGQLTETTLNPNQASIQNNRFEFINGGISPLQQMAMPEQLTIMMDSSGKLVSVERLIQQFQAILSKSQFGTAGGTQKLFIKLNPENLGALRIEMILKDATLIARIQTTTAMAKDMLESQLQNLKNAFHSQNIAFDRIEVSQQLNLQEKYFNRDSQQQQEQQSSGQEQEQNQNSDQPQENSFKEFLLNVEV